MISKFGEFLYTLRKEKGLTQMELADRLGVTNKAVSKWETGEAFPETGQLVPLATVFDITVDELLRGARNETQAPSMSEPAAESVQAETEKHALKPMTKSEAWATAGGVALILAGVLALIILVLNNVSVGIFVPVLLISVAAAVAILIDTSLSRAMRSADLDTDNLKKGGKLALLLSIGVGVIILSPIPIVAMSAFDVAEGIYIPIGIAVAMAGITLVIFAGIQWDAFSKSFNLPSDEAPLNGKGKRIEDAVCGTIMIVATGVFLCIGFVLGKWHPGWIAFVVGGLLCAISSTILKGIYNK